MTRSGEKHVYWSASGQAWRVQIRMKDGTKVYVGDPFKTIPEAVKARDAFLEEYGAEIGAGKDQRGREGFRNIYQRVEYADKGKKYVRYVILVWNPITKNLEHVGSSRDIQVALAIRDAYLKNQK